VRFATSHPILAAAEFRSAMDFSTQILDLDWHEDNSQNCSIEIADGRRNLFEPEPVNMAEHSPIGSFFRGGLLSIRR
jgi:hypothetical protein